MTAAVRPESAHVVGRPTTARVFRATGRVSIRYRYRDLVASGAVVVVALAVTCVQLGTGDYPISPWEVVKTLLGHGSSVQEFIVETLRLPRALTALLVGAAFGASGGIFQSLTRNPLGSPDIIGFTMGASTGAVTMILLFHSQDLGTVLGATIGGLVTSLLVYFLAYKKGVQGYRLILVGIGATAVLESAVSYLLLRANLRDAQNAYIWLVGSLNGAGWEQVVPTLIALLVLVPVAAGMTRQLRALEMGDDTAQALGVRVEASRRWLLLLGTLLCAVAVAAAGPISFVALAAPQIMRRITGSPIGVVSSALMGALLMITSDLLGQRAIPGLELPVGLVTVCVGGLYLLWLLLRENQSSRA